MHFNNNELFYKLSSIIIIKKFINYIIMFQMKCCGITKYQDWASYNNNYDLNNRQVPKSCCKISTTDNKVRLTFIKLIK